MNSTEALREIAGKYFPCTGTKNDREYRKMEQDTLVSDLTALISEHYYPKEFTRWFRSDEFYNIFEESTDDIGITSWEYLLSGQVLYGLDELFNYWKENEQ